MYSEPGWLSGPGKISILSIYARDNVVTYVT